MSLLLLPRSALGQTSSLPPLSLLKLAHHYVKVEDDSTGIISQIIRSFRDLNPMSDVHSALQYINCHSLQWTMQSYFICIKTQPGPQCLPSHSIPSPSCGVLQPWLYIPRMLSDSRLPAAKHLLLCEWCEFVYMLMLLFPSRPAVYFGTRLTFHFAQKSQKSVVSLPDFIYNWILLCNMLLQLSAAICCFRKWKQLKWLFECSNTKWTAESKAGLSIRQTGQLHLQVQK